MSDLPKPEELYNNWTNLMVRKDELVTALVSGEPPAVGEWAKDWECPACGGKWACRYDLRCEVAK